LVVPVNLEKKNEKEKGRREREKGEAECYRKK